MKILTQNKNYLQITTRSQYVDFIIFFTNRKRNQEKKKIKKNKKIKNKIKKCNNFILAQYFTL